MRNGLRIFLVMIAAVISIESLQAQCIPLDTAVHTDKLSNGLTYYIRHNEEPKKRVLMYLVNKVGSILEDDDQQGLAHFMEHMNFNGTRHYPKNELEDYLQKVGVRFGADLNAYTSFDETVFELPIPTDDPSLVNKGLGIIRDWAQDALLDSVDIAEERGVVLEEERLGLGASERMRRQYMPLLLNHSKYASRNPIGLHNILTTFKPEQIRRFHHDWYRPDLQAVIVVGDIDVKQVEHFIKQHFSDLKNPPNERARRKYSIPLTNENRFITVTDKEQPHAEINILVKHRTPQLKTEQDYLNAIKRRLFEQMLSARYRELQQQPGIAFTNAGAGIGRLGGDVDMFSFTVVPRKGQFKQAFQQGWQLIEQVKRYGFAATELDRAKRNYLSYMEASESEANKTSSKNYVSEYQSLFLHQEASPGIAWEYKYVKAHLNSITKVDVDAVAKDYIRDINRDILILAPETDKSDLPDSATVIGWIDGISKEKIAVYNDQTVSGKLLPEKPTAGRVIKEESIPKLGIEELTLSNGVKVILKPTSYKNDEILFNGFASGGTSLSDEQNYISAVNASSVLGSMGLAGYNPVQLSRLLTGKMVRVETYIGDRTEGVHGSTTVKDLETAMQLMYLKFTWPGKDTTIFNNIIASAGQSLENKYANPTNVFEDTINYIMGGYNDRYKPFTKERLKELNLDSAFSFYKDHFGDASGFTFVLVGNFNIDSIRPLLETYLGSLPSTGRREKARDIKMHPQEGQLTRKVYAGREDKATVRLVLSDKYDYNEINNLSLYLLGEVLEIKLIQDLREAAAEIYSPSVNTGHTKYPENRYTLTISFGCAPKNVDHLISMVQKELDTLREEGPRTVDLEKVKIAYQKQLEQVLQTNDFWLSYLYNKYENRDDLFAVLNIQETLEKITVTTLKKAAARYVSGNNFIKFELLPETAVEP